MRYKHRYCTLIEKQHCPHCSVHQMDGSFSQLGYSVVQHSFLDHPYGLATSSNGSLVYASNQNVNNVVRFHPLGPAYASTVIKVSNPRGIALTPDGTLFVASTKNPGGLYWYEGIDKIADGVVATPSGRLDWIPHPVGVAYDANTALLFVGSYNKKHEEKSCVFVLDVSSMPPRRVACLRPDSPHKLVHPAGIAVSTVSRRVYVVAQEARCVYAFQIGNATGCGTSFGFLGVAIQDLPPQPEQIGLVAPSLIAERC